MLHFFILYLRLTKPYALAHVCISTLSKVLTNSQCFERLCGNLGVAYAKQANALFTMSIRLFLLNCFTVFYNYHLIASASFSSFLSLSDIRCIRW